MTRLLWDQVGERRIETGVDRGVLYLPNNAGVYDMGYAWNGLTAVTESPSGAESNKQYADNQVYINLMSAEDFGGTIEAFTYPTQFAACDGSAVSAAGVYIGQQDRQSFGLSYRTLVKTDTNPNAGYKVHLVYGAMASPSEKGYSTVNDSPEGVGLSWEFSTTPVAISTQVGGKTLKPSAIITVDSTQVPAANLQALEDALYGTAGTAPRLPTPDEVIAMFAGALTVVTPTIPTATTAGLITIPNVTGVEYRRGDTNVKVTGTVQISGAIGSSLIIKAVPASGNYVFTAGVDDDWLFTKTT